MTKGCGAVLRLHAMQRTDDVTRTTIQTAVAETNHIGDHRRRSQEPKARSPSLFTSLQIHSPSRIRTDGTMRQNYVRTRMTPSKFTATYTAVAPSSTQNISYRACGDRDHDTQYDSAVTSSGHRTTNPTSKALSGNERTNATNNRRYTRQTILPIHIPSPERITSALSAASCLYLPVLLPPAASYRVEQAVIRPS